MVPFASVFNTDEGIWKSVVDPMFETEKSVDVAPVEVVDEITNNVRFIDVDAAWSDNSAYGEVLPNPRLPVVGLKRKVDVPADPKATVDDAKNPPMAKSGEVVAEVVVPKFVPTVNG